VQTGTNSALFLSNIFSPFTGSESEKKIIKQLSFCLPSAFFQFLTSLLDSEDGSRKFVRNVCNVQYLNSSRCTIRSQMSSKCV
jgi:hypothetical protein